MNDIVTRWRRRPDDLEAGLVAEHTAQKIALWCGGVVNRERDRGVDEYLELLVPNIEGTQKAHVNDYVVRKNDGRFYVMTMADMNEYEELGKRSDPKPGALTPHYVARGAHPFAQNQER